MYEFNFEMVFFRDLLLAYTQTSTIAVSLEKKLCPSFRTSILIQTILYVLILESNLISIEIMLLATFV